MFGPWEKTLRNLSVRSLSTSDALQLIDELGVLRRLIDGLLADLAKQVDDPKRVAQSLRVPVGEVRAAVETATLLEDLPLTAAAVRSGELSPPQVRMIANAASANPSAEERLLNVANEGLVSLRDACVVARAEVEDPAQRAARHRKERTFRMWTDIDGMVAGQFRLAPEIGGKIKAAFDAKVQRMFRAQTQGEHESRDACAADAFAAFVLGGEAARVEANVHILIDHGALMRGGTAEGEVCEIAGIGPVDVGWVRELLGSAFLTAVIKRGKDILSVAHLGRHIPAEVQTALLVSGRECDVVDCYHRGYLERDHQHDLAKGGPTAYWNLGWLCYAHHRLKSSGWILGPPDPKTRKRKLSPPRTRAA
jgi:hypothetical protein